MNALLAWIRNLWARNESDEVARGEQQAEWERLEGVHDDTHPPELDDLR
jgi:hypothetical protein